MRGPPPVTPEIFRVLVGVCNKRTPRPSLAPDTSFLGPQFGVTGEIGSLVVPTCDLHRVTTALSTTEKVSPVFSLLLVLLLSPVNDTRSVVTVGSVRTGTPSPY